MTLRSTCRELVLQAVIRRAMTAAENENDDLPARVQMVVDEPTMKVLTSVVRMGDLYEEGVTGVELLEREREPLPDLDVLYFLNVEASSIDRVLVDFKGGAQGPQHRQVHFAFCKPVFEGAMDRLADSADLAPRVRSFVEVPLSFVMIQDRGFHFDMPQAITGLFPNPNRTLLQDTSRRLADVCRCLQAFSPVIRYAKNSSLCADVAKSVDVSLKESLKGQSPSAAAKNAVPCELLIVDRSLDMAATLVHEYSYECMVYDLLDVKKRPATDGVRTAVDGDRDLVTRSGKRDMLLNDADPMWEQLKHQHFTEVQERIKLKVEEVMERQGEMKDSSLTIDDLREQLMKMPEHKELVGRVDLHLDLVRAIDNKLKEEMITEDLGQLEQDLACGINQHGKDVKISSLQSQLKKVLEDDRISKESKLRLLMLMFASVTNVSETPFDKDLRSAAKLSGDELHVIMSMLKSKLMEVPNEQRQNKDGKGMVHRVTKEQASRFKRNAKTENRFVLSRFEPRVKEVLERLAVQKLSKEDYEVLMDESTNDRAAGLRETAGDIQAAPVAPAAGDDWAFTEPPNPDDEEPAESREISRRLILFIVGGITQSELRAAAEVAATLPAETEVLIGGTSLLTPQRLIDALKPHEGIGNDSSGVDLT